MDVALRAPDREGDQRNWHAHSARHYAQGNLRALTEKCAIEFSDAKRLSLGLVPVRIEVEAVRQMWTEEVNRHSRRGDGQSGWITGPLAAQRKEAIQKGDPERWRNSTGPPQVKLSWKVVQMERRGVSL